MVFSDRWTYQDEEIILTDRAYLHESEAEEAAEAEYYRRTKSNYAKMVAAHPSANFAPYDKKRAYGYPEGAKVEIVRVPLR